MSDFIKFFTCGKSRDKCCTVTLCEALNCLVYHENNVLTSDINQNAKDGCVKFTESTTDAPFSYVLDDNELQQVIAT